MWISFLNLKTSPRKHDNQNHTSKWQRQESQERETSLYYVIFINKTWCKVEQQD